jgi:hypothetical protein
MRRAITSFIAARAQQLSAPAAYLGTWWEDKTLYLDVSRKIEDHYEAHKTAYKQDQVALYGVKGQKVHWVMGDHSRPTDKSGSKPLFESKAAPDKLFFDARHLDPKKIAQEVADKFCPDLPEG